MLTVVSLKDASSSAVRLELALGTTNQDNFSNSGLRERVGDSRANSVAATGDQDGLASELLFQECRAGPRVRVEVVLGAHVEVLRRQGESN